jgi:methionine-rich copper-binding protein CopC
MATLVLLVLAPAVALGHAELVATSPEAGSTITEQPLEITASFDEDLVIDQSDISLRNATGERIARGRVDPAEPAILRLAPPPALPPGEYEVRWVAAANDGHIERGSFKFTLAPPTQPSPLPSPSPSAVPSNASSATPQSSTSPSPSSSPSPAASASSAPSPSPSPQPAPSDASSAVIPIVAALILLGLLALWLTRRRRG